MKYTAVIAVVLLCCAGARCTQLLDASHPFPEQAARLLSRIRMSEKDLAAVPQVLRDLELVLGTEWPGCEVLPYGSTVTGLALVGSDIDANAMLPGRALKSHGAILIRAISVLLRSPDYANIQIPPRPYSLTLQHVPSQTKIDLQFNNLEGGRNSALLLHILNMDERARNLALIAKYWWAKIRKLAGYKMIPSYGMTCMVVFYLQQVGVLPSIMLLQKDAKPLTYQYWNTGFHELVYKSSNNESLYQILGGFFEYYDDFNYEKFIISPFIGYPVERKLFKSVKSVPAEFENYHRNVGYYGDKPLDLSDAVIVQDVFLHNSNLAMLIQTREDSLFTTEFRRAARALGTTNENTFLDELLDVQISDK